MEDKTFFTGMTGTQRLAADRAAAAAQKQYKKTEYTIDIKDDEERMQRLNDIIIQAEKLRMQAENTATTCYPMVYNENGYTAGVPRRLYRVMSQMKNGYPNPNLGRFYYAHKSEEGMLSQFKWFNETAWYKTGCAEAAVGTILTEILADTSGAMLWPERDSAVHRLLFASVRTPQEIAACLNPGFDDIDDSDCV